MPNNVYVDFHVIQTVPPSCINRDDTGSPKTAIFGGKTRSRVSSQAWKHSMRKEFASYLNENEIGYRTKNVKNLIKKELSNIDSSISDDDAEKTVAELLEVAGIKSGGDKKDVLFFISKLQIKALAEIAYTSLTKREKLKDKKEDLKAALKDTPSVDIVLFGRMSASDPSLNYDATSQVAHSISTHAVSNEFDYFTAVDDCTDDDNSGAGHLGTVEFNSSTLYRYATVNAKEMLNYLSKEESIKAVCAFAKAFVLSMPTGKQNTFANRTYPEMVYITIRTDQPANFANAFEKPVTSGEDGYSINSQKALAAYAEKVYENWASIPAYSWCVGDILPTEAIKINFPELINDLERKLSDLLPDSERV